MSAKYLIIGKGGQLSRALAEQLGPQAISLGYPELDLGSPDFARQLEALAKGQRFSAVINAAAHTQVDKAEGEERVLAFAINAEAAAVLADWCAQRQIPLVHYSTDYVFNGSGSAPWKETDTTSPINAYGESKLKGEESIRLSGAPYLIFRTSWVYDGEGKNFYTTIRRLLREKEGLNIVDDQVGAPTYAPHLAAGSLTALEKALAQPKFPSGTYHLCGGGQTSWCGFAQAIFALARDADSGVRCRHVNPIPSSAYPLPAKRPLNSRLDCGKALKTFGVALPRWEEGLKECFNGSEGLQTRRA